MKSEGIVRNHKQLRKIMQETGSPYWQDYEGTIKRLLEIVDNQEKQIEIWSRSNGKKHP